MGDNYTVQPGDIPCVVELEFCDDGTGAKTWDPDPTMTLPAHARGDGTWFMAAGNQLSLSTDDGMTATTEQYSMAMVYQNGADIELDLNGYTKADSNPDMLAGTYNKLSDVFMSVFGGSIMDMQVITSNVLTVTGAGYVDYDYSDEVTTTQWCLEGGMMVGVCPIQPPIGPPGVTDVTTDVGTIAPPGELIEVNGSLVLQLNPAGVYVLQYP